LVRGEYPDALPEIAGTDGVSRPLFRRTWVRIVLGVLVIALVGLGIGLAIVLPAPLPRISPQLAARTPSVTHGAYLAIAGDCAACHTRPGGPAFAGGLPLNTPIGRVYSSNITSDFGHGMGRYTLPEFIRLMREGVARDGRRIYPAMPYTAYTRITDADLQDLHAYFTRAVAPVAETPKDSDIPWPLSIRWPLAFWNKAFLDDRRFVPTAGQSIAWNRGAYLIEGLGHCGTCHTPRGIAFNEKATRDDGHVYLAGSALDGQSPSNLRNDPWTGIGRWSAADIIELLKTARTSHSAVAGQMTEVVSNSTQYMSDADIAAIATYLKTLRPVGDDHAGFRASPATFQRFMTGRAKERGAQIYMDSCSACHRLDGRGVTRAFPNLNGNSTVLHRNPDSLITIILGGARLPSTQGAPSRLAMPPYGWRFSDAEVATLATWLRNSWGNKAPEVTATDVARLRPKANSGAARQN
jgi:mono/diheme cytochrome c family protein